jgi:hypothetical protein
MGLAQLEIYFRGGPVMWEIVPACFVHFPLEEHAMKSIDLKWVAAGLMGVSALLLVTAMPANASHWNGHPDMESSILNDHDRPDYMGTGLTDTRKRVFIYGAPDSAFPNSDLDTSGFVTGRAGPEKGDGDSYGSILYDVGTTP